MLNIVLNPNIFPDVCQPWFHKMQPSVLLLHLLYELSKMQVTDGELLLFATHLVKSENTARVDHKESMGKGLM